MSVKDSLKADLITAMKAKEKDRVDTIRLVTAAVKKKEIDGGKELDDAGVFAVLNSMVKQRQDSIEQFKKGGRDDLVAKEEAQLAILQTYLPKPLSESELSELVQNAITEAGATGMQDMGKVMKLVLDKAGGRADGKLVSSMVREKLS